MKNMILAGLFVLGTSTAMAELSVNEVNDGQILSVVGWKDMMPSVIDPVNPVRPQSEGQLTVKVAAISGGCTSPDSFKVELKKLTTKTYLVSATRTQVDPCEAVARVITFEKTIVAPMEVFDAVSTHKAQILAEPYVSVGIAY